MAIYTAWLISCLAWVGCPIIMIVMFWPRDGMKACPSYLEESTGAMRNAALRAAMERMPMMCPRFPLGGIFRSRACIGLLVGAQGHGGLDAGARAVYASKAGRSFFWGGMDSAVDAAATSAPTGIPGAVDPADASWCQRRCSTQVGGYDLRKTRSCPCRCVCLWPDRRLARGVAASRRCSDGSDLPGIAAAAGALRPAGRAWGKGPGTAGSGLAARGTQGLLQFIVQLGGKLVQRPFADGAMALADP